MRNTVIQGDCTTVLPTIPEASVDFVITDPPYFVDYNDRAGRTVRNDKYPGAVLDAFKEMSRVLKPDSLCVSFYSWTHAAAFAEVWRAAQLRPVGHIVFTKTYASGQHYLRYAHECAYVLAKGRPELPEHPISDVQPWHYSGNHRHPNEKAVETLKPIIEAFTKAGDLVLDPFAGSGSSLVAAALLRRDYIGIELEAKYCELVRRRLEGVTRHLNSASRASPTNDYVPLEAQRSRRFSRSHGSSTCAP